MSAGGTEPQAGGEPQGGGEPPRTGEPRDAGGSTSGTGLRVGVGFDAHRFATERPLILGGLRLREMDGLSGHSDADVLTHAIMDALLGAAGLGDIGERFPDSDPAYADASSLDLLETVSATVRRRGWEVVNVDAVVICEEPRIAPHRPEMRERLAGAMGVAIEQVNLRGTTTERLGFPGRREGIAAQAVALLKGT